MLIHLHFVEYTYTFCGTVAFILCVNWLEHIWCGV